MKKIIPQFEIPGADSVFNLVIESTLDGARLEKEKQQAEQQAEADRKAAEAQQERLQL